jgi:hypothetical protein
MDTRIKECCCCEEQIDWGCHEIGKPICDSCVEKLCKKISKKHYPYLVKHFVRIDITSSQDGYLFGSAVITGRDKDFFIPFICLKTNKGFSIMFANKENDRDEIIKKNIQ